MNQTTTESQIISSFDELDQLYELAEVDDLDDNQELRVSDLMSSLKVQVIS